MAKRNYYKVPKNVSEMTEEELEAFASAIYENLMAKFTTDQFGMPNGAREAICFAILGNETIMGTPANVPQATGAKHAVILGKITPP